MQTNQHTSMSGNTRIRRMIAVGVFVALAYICCVLFHFKAAFLSFDLKDAVMTIGAMFFGPLAGLIMALLTCLIEFVTISSTGVYGLLMNLFSSITFVCIGSLVYSKKRTMSGAFIGMVAATIVMVAVMMGANLLITPYYMGATRAQVASYIPTLLFPFNLTKGIFNSAVVFLLYKPVSQALKASGFVKNGVASTSTTVPVSKEVRKKRSMLVMGIALVVVVLTLLYFFLSLQGSFSIL